MECVQKNGPSEKTDTGGEKWVGSVVGMGKYNRKYILLLV